METSCGIHRSNSISCMAKSGLEVREPQIHVYLYEPRPWQSARGRHPLRLGFLSFEYIVCRMKKWIFTGSPTALSLVIQLPFGSLPFPLLNPEHLPPSLADRKACLHRNRPAPRKIGRTCHAFGFLSFERPTFLLFLRRSALQFVAEVGWLRTS